jgi:endonuclease III
MVNEEIIKVFSILEKTHPLTMLEELSHYTAFQTLVMTLLSARTKDSTVIPLVKKMFARLKEPQDYVDIPQEELEKYVYGVGFFRVKSKHIKQLSRILIDDYNGIVPDTLKELTSLPGVGRKTANCMLAYVFKKPAIAVDIHVHRIANRLGWIKTSTPEKSEFTLMEKVPRGNWIDVNRLLVGHGQTICKPIGPLCNQCSIIKFCDYGKKKTIKPTTRLP